MAEGQAPGGALAARQILDRFNSAIRRGDVGLALGVILILMVLILPLAPWALDIGLSLSLTIAVLILMVSIFIEKPNAAELIRRRRR